MYFTYLLTYLLTYNIVINRVRLQTCSRYSVIAQVQVTQYEYKYMHSRSRVLQTTKLCFHCPSSVKVTIVYIHDVQLPSIQYMALLGVFSRNRQLMSHQTKFI